MESKDELLKKVPADKETEQKKEQDEIKPEDADKVSGGMYRVD